MLRNEVGFSPREQRQNLVLDPIPSEKWRCAVPSAFNRAALLMVIAFGVMYAGDHPARGWYRAVELGAVTD